MVITQLSEPLNWIHIGHIVYKSAVRGIL